MTVDEFLGNKFLDNEFLDNEFLDNEFLDNEFLGGVFMPSPVLELGQRQLQLAASLIGRRAQVRDLPP